MGKNTLSNNEIYASLLKEELETFYYKGENTNDKTVKFPRIGKFNLEEIKDLLKVSEFPDDQQNKIYEAFKALETQKKTKFETSALSFSILAIKRKINYLIDDSTLGLDKTFCDNFIKKLKIQLREKLSPNNAEVFMKMRDIGENKTRNLDTKLSPSYEIDLFQMASRRKDADLIKAIISYNPDIIKKVNKSALINPLEYAVASGNFELFKILIKKGANIDEVSDAALRAADKKGFTSITNFVEIIRLLKLKPTDIDLSGCKVEDMNIKEVTKLLKTSAFLTEIDLGANIISDESFKYIAALLEKNTSLTSINLMGTRIGSEGAKALAKALKTNTALTNINLDLCEISNEGIIAITSALKKNTTLTNIVFSDDEIDKDQMVIIQEYLERNKALQKNKAEEKKENISGEMKEKVPSELETKDAEMQPLNIHILENIPDTNPKNPTSPKNKNDNTEKQK